MGLASRGRRGCTSPATVFSAIVLLALTTWATLLYRVFALPTAHHPPSASASCFSEERLMWSQRVVLPDRTLPAAIHVSADGKVKAVHQHQPRLEAEILAKRLGVRFEPWDAEALSPAALTQTHTRTLTLISTLTPTLIARPSPSSSPSPSPSPQPEPKP